MSLLGYHVPLLRAISDEIGLLPIPVIAQQPGVSDACRITVHYYDRRACDSVATAVKRMADAAALEIVFRRALEHKPLAYPLDEGRFRALLAALKAGGFDKLADQPGLPAYDSTDVWMVERAAGGFYKSVVVAPEIAGSPPHQAVIDAVRVHLPEALRMVR
jgi:hypothetical protein